MRSVVLRRAGRLFARVAIVPLETESTHNRLEAERDTIERKIEEVRTLLARADQRLREDPENRRRWLSVVENLEASLIELRARQQRNEIELKQAETSQATPTREPQLGHPLTESSTHLLESVAAMPLVSASAMTLEQAARIESLCREGGGGELNDTRRAQVLARVELANQSPPTYTDDAEELPARRTQLALRGAIDKIQHGRIDTMTSDEVRMTVACYDLIRRRVNPTPSDQRLTRILGAAINILNRKHAEFSHR